MDKSLRYIQAYPQILEKLHQGELRFWRISVCCALADDQLPRVPSAIDWASLSAYSEATGLHIGLIKQVWRCL